MIKTLLATVVVTVALITGTFAREADDKVPPPPAAVDESAAFNPIVRLSGGCTGFYIGDGKFLTAGHCMGKKTAWTLDTENANGGKKTFKVDTMIYSHPGDWNAQDTAIVFVDPILTKDLKVIELDCSGDIHPVGTRIATEGFPEDYGRNYTVGAISALPSPWAAGRGGWWKDVYRTQLPVSYGNSGGPVFSLDTGKVIGILVGILPNNRSLSVVQPIDFACHVLGLGSHTNQEK